MTNKQHVDWSLNRTPLHFFMDIWRAQETRRRKKLPYFPCKSADIYTFTGLAATVDPRIRTRDLRLPPDAPEGRRRRLNFITLGG